MEASAEKPAEKLTVKDYVYLVSAGVSNAVLVMLGIGLLTQTIANFVNWPQLHQVGAIAQWLLAPAFGAAVASQLKTNTLVLFSSMISATVGANAVYFISSGVHAATATGNQMAQVAGAGVFTTGQPISAVAAGLIAALVGKYLSGKTPLDMMLVPLSATLVGSMCVALAWSIFLMTPASSAALAVAVMLDPLSSGAALIGTTAQFVGFTVISWRQNNLGANIAQGVITPKVQFPNLLANPRLAIPSMLSAIVAAPIATLFFGFKVPYTLGGLGLNSFIAPLNLASTSMNMFVAYLIMGIVVPAAISVVSYRLLLGLHWVKDQQLHLEIV